LRKPDHLRVCRASLSRLNEGDEIMLAGLLLLTILTMKLFPRVPVSRQLHRLLVEMPLAALAKMSRRHHIFGVVLMVMLVSASEMIMLLGSADVVMLLAWDVSIYVDAVIAAWTLAAMTRSKAAWQAFAAIATRPLRAARRRAPRRRPAGSEKAANDSDEDGRAWVYAFAA
jgi:hypothetical protein